MNLSVKIFLKDISNRSTKNPTKTTAVPIHLQGQLEKASESKRLLKTATWNERQ